MILVRTHHILQQMVFIGSDSWTAEEKRYFNKGISAYRKDFFVVQKLVGLFVLSCNINY